MRKGLVVIGFLFVTNASSAQISVGPEIAKKTKKQQEFGANDLEILRNTRTLFVYRSQDEKHLDSFKAEMSRVWDYTELEFISYSDYARKQISGTYSDGYSFLTIKSYLKVYTFKDGTSTRNVFNYLQLWTVNSGDLLNFCRLELFPTPATIDHVYKNEMGFIEKMKFLYDKAEYYNWNLVSLKNALNFFNRRLKKSEEYLFAQTKRVSLELTTLISDTLYVPEYCLYYFKSSVGYDKTYVYSKSSLFHRYSYAYRVVSVDELNGIIKHTQKPVLYLSSIRTDTAFYIGVIDGRTGEYVYSSYRYRNRNISTEDIHKIARAAKKSK